MSSQTEYPAGGEPGAEGASGEHEASGGDEARGGQEASGGHEARGEHEASGGHEARGEHEARGGQAAGGAQGAGAGSASQQAGAPSEEQLRAAYEAELSRIASVDMVLQAAASLLNIGAHRLGLTGGPASASPPTPQDLEQVRDAIDAVRGLLPVIERSAPSELRPLRDALSQLQMAFSRVIQSVSPPPVKPDEQSAPVSAPPPASDDPPQDGAPEEKSGPGPAESSGRLWLPGR